MTENRMLYDEMCRVLTDYKGNGSEESAIAGDLYDMLAKIQNRWEYIVTSSTGTRDILADWLAGAGPFMCKLKGYHYTLIRVRKNADFDYLYTQRQYNNTDIERGSKFEYAGLYCRRNGLVYDCQYAARDLFDEPNSQDARSEEALLKYLKAAVRCAVESAIGNDRNNLRIAELSSERMLNDLERFQQYTSASEARRTYLGGEDSCDGKDFEFTYQCSYQPEQWTEDSLLAYILDPDGYVQAEVKKYIDSHQEVMLLAFLTNDMVAAAYKEIIDNPSYPVHLVKRIIAAVSASPAKTVTVTIRKNGSLFTFKTEAREYRYDCTSHYSDWNIMAADRKEFERLFGSSARYRPEDIVRIEYARSVLYENEAAGAEECDES